MLRHAFSRIVLPRAAANAAAAAVEPAPRSLVALRALSNRAVSRGPGGAGKGAGASSSSQAVAARPSTAAGAGGLSRVFDNMFASSDPFFSDPFFRPFMRDFGGMGGGMGMGMGMGMDVSPMGLDISETKTHFVVKAELPGIKKEDVRITMQEGVLTIEAERKVEESGEDKDSKRHYSDFAYGKMTRSLRLPDAADANHVEAQLEDGVLKVAIKRAEHAQPKTIAIH